MVGLEGLKVLVEEYRRRAAATAAMYANRAPPGYEQERDWPTTAEGERIERLLAEAYRDTFGQESVPPAIWRGRNEFAGRVAAGATSLTAFAEWYAKLERWADDTLKVIAYIESERKSAAPARRTVRIAFLSAMPTDRTPLRLDEELRAVREELERSRLRDAFAIEARGAVRPRDLRRVLLDVHPDIVHFSGHGSATGAVYLEDENGETHEVEPAALADLISAVGGVRCVVLNACFSARQAAAIARHVPHVVGVPGEIGDDAAIHYAAAFYGALLVGRAVPDAHAIALAEVRILGHDASVLPQLIETVR